MIYISIYKQEYKYMKNFNTFQGTKPIIKAIVDIARSLSVGVVAEGIESKT